ncbi:tyrosine-type recombinase/integrase [Sanguibacter sp. A246]|uniref:tyrosine-type recombinase/integrase n=1 Tax=Sanguibacter sp. A246 TaxID=3457326 RepID=UPI003FD744DB
MRPETWAAAIEEYVYALKAARRAASTIRVYRHYLRHLSQFAATPWHVTIRDLNRALSPGQWSAETAKTARTTYVGFYRWALLADYIDVDPALRLAPITVPPPAPRPAPESVLAIALSAADDRTTLMLRLAAFGGLRCAEIASVHAEAFDGELLRVVGKGDKKRDVPVLDDVLIDALTTTRGFLFPSDRSPTGHLSPGHVSKLMSRVLPGAWTGHTLRHRFSTRSYDENPDLLSLCKVMGHARPETTLRYTRISNDKLRAVVAAAQ